MGLVPASPSYRPLMPVSRPRRLIEADQGSESPARIEARHPSAVHPAGAGPHLARRGGGAAAVRSSATLRVSLVCAKWRVTSRKGSTR